MLQTHKKKKHWRLKSRSGGAGGVSLSTALTRIHKFTIMAFGWMPDGFLPNLKCARRTNLPGTVIILKDLRTPKKKKGTDWKTIRDASRQKKKRQRRRLCIPPCLSCTHLKTFQKRFGGWLNLSVWRRERREKRYREYLLPVSRHLQWPCRRV